MNNIHPTPRTYHDIGFLIEIYNFMDAYEKAHNFKISIAELAVPQFSEHVSVIRYYLLHMERLGMIERPSITIGGQKRTPPRSIILKPLDKADPLIQTYINGAGNGELNEWHQK